MFFVSTNFTTSGIVKDSYAFFTTCSKSSFDKNLQRMDTKDAKPGLDSLQSQNQRFLL